MLLSTSLFCSCDKKLTLSPISPVDICSWMVTFLFRLDNTIKNHFLICKVNSIDEVLNCYCLYRNMAFISPSFMPSWDLWKKILISSLPKLVCFVFCTLVWDAWHRQMTFALQTVYGEASDFQSRLNCSSKVVLLVPVTSYLIIVWIWNVKYIWSLCC